MEQSSGPRRGLDDRRLVAGVVRGEEQAFGELYDRYAATVYAVALRVLGEGADADDVVADTFEKVWRRADGYDPRRGSVAAWLVVMTRNRAIDLLRARRCRDGASEAVANSASADAPDEGWGTESPEGATVRAEHATEVRRALEALSPERRAAIELAYFEGLSQSEIARRLGEPLGTVKTRIRTGMQQLRALLRPLFEDRLA